MITYIFILTTVLVISTAEVQQINLTDGTYTWSSGNPYPAESQYLIVEAEEGYLVHVTITDCDISGEDGDFMLIKAGKSLEYPGSGRIFTYNLKSAREYVVHSNAVFLSFQVFGLNEKQKSGAVVVFERFGEQVLTTTQPSVSTTVWPEHTANDSIYYDNAVTSTTTDIDFYDNETISDLRWTISQMATKFCEDEVILLSENITEDNVLVQDMKLCPFYWPESEKCFWINFSLPVVLEENQTQWTGYELTRDNLERMWNRYAEQYLDSMGLKPYTKPDDDFMMLMWTLIIGGVIAAFIVVLFVMRYLMMSLTRKDKRDFSDTASIISKHRDSNLSLDPHPLQSIPQLFENDFPMYEPGLSVAPEGYDNHGLSDDDSEEEIINTHSLNLSVSSARLQESES